jgi:2-methylcitrate dehydratase PrpD
VEKLIVSVGKDRAAITNNRSMPDINMQQMIAVMLLDGGVSFKSSHDFKRMRDPKVVRLRDRIELTGDLEVSTPKLRWYAKVEITLRDGRTLEHYTRAARGSSENPMTREEEDAKALDLLAPVLGKKRAQTLIATVWNVEKLKDARELGKLCRAS